MKNYFILFSFTLFFSVFTYIMFVQRFEIGDCIADTFSDDDITYMVLEINGSSYLLDNFSTDDNKRFITLPKRLVNRNFVKTECLEGDAE